MSIAPFMEIIDNMAAKETASTFCCNVESKIAIVILLVECSATRDSVTATTVFALYWTIIENNDMSLACGYAYILKFKIIR